MFRKDLLAALFALLVSFNSLASDVEKEKRWADQIVDALIEGEAVWLAADGQEFLGIFTEAEEPDSKRGAIIAHGIGVHPDWQQVVYPLRTSLPTLGWYTLSLQMPILANEAEEAQYAVLMKEVAPRLDAGVAFLKERGMEKIVIIGHSLGSTMASYYLSTADRDIEGFVAIGMSAGTLITGAGSAELVTTIKIPMLDLYGSVDSPEVLSAVPEREQAKSDSAGKDYASRKIEGANHFFDGKEDKLVDAVHTWLTATIAGE